MGQQPLIAPPDRPGDRSTEVAAHTPGPWRLCPVYPPQTPESWDVIGATDWCVAEHIENEADAHLIAAAPDMLAALRAVLVAYSEPKVWTSADAAAIRAARAAIAKATGG